MNEENKPLTRFICFDVYGIWTKQEKIKIYKYIFIMLIF